MSAKYKWAAKDIEAAFEYRRCRPNLSKVRKYQKFTDDLDECIEWCVNSIKNDREQKLRATSHYTGAY